MIGYIPEGVPFVPISEWLGDNMLEPSLSVSADVEFGEVPVV